jgi:hypothetical protein
MQNMDRVGVALWADEIVRIETHDDRLSLQGCSSCAGLGQAAAIAQHPRRIVDIQTTYLLILPVEL